MSPPALALPTARSPAKRTRMYLDTVFEMALSCRGQRQETQPVTTTVCISSFSFNIRKGMPHGGATIKIHTFGFKDDHHWLTLRINLSLQTRRQRVNSHHNAFQKHISVVPFTCKLPKEKEAAVHHALVRQLKIRFCKKL